MTTAKEPDLLFEYQFSHRGNKEEQEDRLIKEHWWLAVSVANQYWHPRVEKEDILSYALIGLLNAIRTFDFNKGYQFSTYATRIMTNEILRNFNYENIESRNPQDTVLSIDRTLYDDNNTTLADVITDDSESVTGYANAIGLKEIINKLLSNEIALFTDIERNFLSYQLAHNCPMRVVGEHFGYSVNQTSRVLERARTKLKQYLMKNWFI